MLQFQELTYRLSHRLLFEKASANIPEGAHVGFVGRNGAGKTTLFRLICQEMDPENGQILYPRRLRLGRVEQEAPGGPLSLLDYVLQAQTERSELLHMAEHATDPHEIALIQERLTDIQAYAAPARAATILTGLGFSAKDQARPLFEFSGGWRMRVALAGVLMARPDLLLLDEPTNYLDLEGTLWLVDYLKREPATLLLISHDRDVLDGVCDHILHLDQTKLTLWRGNYSSFEKQKNALALVQERQRLKQEEKRLHLQSFIDRFRAQATKARQAQSRLKILAKMEPVASMIEEHVLPFYFQSPQRPLPSPLLKMEEVEVGYDNIPILRHLSLQIAHDDRIGLLGSNGNGKSTFAKLLAGRLLPFSGKLTASRKMKVGFFAQHQAEELGENGTPYTLVAARMQGAFQTHIRSRCALLGFPHAKADTPLSQLSGGEKARLLMGLATFEGPHLLILDEPTNHLDIDSRAALLEALNAYEGAVLLISHDQYLLEACADRLWRVTHGSVVPFEGDMQDYQRLVLQEAAKMATSPPTPPSSFLSTPPPSRSAAREHQKRMQALEARIEQLSDLIQRVDTCLAQAHEGRDPTFEWNVKGAEFVRHRQSLTQALEKTEEEWLALSCEATSINKEPDFS